MVKLVQLLVEYQENKSEDAFNEILKMVESIIYFVSLKVRKDYQEDLRQECCLKLLESILDFEIKSIISSVIWLVSIEEIRSLFNPSIFVKSTNKS